MLPRTVNLNLWWAKIDSLFAILFDTKMKTKPMLGYVLVKYVHSSPVSKMIDIATIIENEFAGKNKFKKLSKI